MNEWVFFPILVVNYYTVVRINQDANSKPSQVWSTSRNLFPGLSLHRLEKLALDKKPEGLDNCLQTPGWLGKGPLIFLELPEAGCNFENGQVLESSRTDKLNSGV